MFLKQSLRNICLTIFCKKGIPNPLVWKKKVGTAPRDTCPGINGAQKIYLKTCGSIRGYLIIQNHDFERIPCRTKIVEGGGEVSVNPPRIILYRPRE